MTGSFRVQLINMGTRAAAFQAKLRCLHDYHLRLLHNIVPPPSGIDIANTIKYFSQTFLTVLKDVPISPHQMIKDPAQDHLRMSAYPNLEYGNLYNAIAMLLDVAHNIQFGLNDNLFCKKGTSGARSYKILFYHISHLLQCLATSLPFLDKDLIDNIPYLTASCICVLPPALHQDVINTLCYYILPFTITRQSIFEDQECHSCQSVSSVIMLVFQYSNNPAHHCQLLECLMTFKQNVVKDLLCVIAYGTAISRSSAAKLLFYYWPAFNANLFDRKGLLSKLTNDMIPFICQRDNCPNAGNSEAAKVCYDHNVSITYATDCPPPLYLCIECANEIHRENPNQTFGDLLHPMAQVSMVCENKNCRSTEKSAISICFSPECASYNGNHPIRYCAQCHGNRHNSRRGGDHIVHRSLPPTWQMDAEMQTYMVEAVISLLREAKPLSFEPGRDSSEARSYPYNMPQDNISLEERQQLGRYGIWLLVGRCTPTPDTPVEILSRLLSMLFHWFHVTAYSNDVQIESTVEKLKVEHVCGWLKEICQSHYKEFISCLLPHPPEYARVGGHWDTLASKTCHLKEGLQRLICLVPYEVIITSEIWDIVMPHWMEAITNDVPEKELGELKVVLSKILDADCNPLGFDAKTLYNFVTIRFEKTTAKVQQQALHWLQILSKLEILIPLSQLFAMFGDGVRIMKQLEMNKEKDERDCKPGKDKDAPQPPRRSSISPVVEDDSGNTSAMSDDEAPTSRHTEFSTDAEHNLTCCILMLDILLKQLELQDIEQHMGINTNVCENVCRLLKCMVTAARVGLGSHVCALKVSECAYCEASIMWHQLSTKLVQYMAPENPIRPPDAPIEEVFDDEKPVRKSPPESDKSKDRDCSLSMAPLPIPLGPLGFGGKMPSILDDPGKIIIMAGPVPVAVPQPDPHSVSGVLVHMPHVCSIMTATVETVSEQLDLAAIMPSEKVVSAIARSITLSDADVATATAQVSKPSLVIGPDVDKINESVEDLSDELEDGEDFWHTSVGKFKFALDTLPQPLQYIHKLLSELPTIEKPDILYYMLQCLNILALHGDALAKAAREQRGFFIWCQENLLIKNLWDLCNAEYSHIAEACVPLLLHCITLPLGSDVFWRIVQESFHDADWRIRFTAVERVTVITRFMDSTPLRTEVGLQTALATAFCHLIASMDDVNVHVAQRSTLYLGTIHDKAITSLLFCLESQFDLFIVDRPVVLQSLYQLHNSLSDRRVLGWDFFLNRFDTLFVEAQINLEKTGDITYPKDLRNSENGSEILSNKISKAREALSQSDTTCSMAKTLSASFGPKWPYKRTMSAPANIIPRQDSKLEKEKVYSRQISAPILKRKSSRFGLGQFLSSGTNNSSNMQSFGGDETNLAACLHRIIDLEEADKETIHLLVFLLMQFLSRADQAFPSEEKSMAKMQSIVLKHLYLLLGYSHIEKSFHVTPSRMRSSAVFNVFMANLPQVLDQNHLMGWCLLNTSFQVLLYAPNPNPINSNASENLQNIATHNYTYSLWYLETHVRRNWLMSVLVILYKYQYGQPPYSGNIANLIRIILNSLEAHFHQCKRIPATIVMDFLPTNKSREVSQPSLGADQDDRYDLNSPPASPLFAEGTSQGSQGATTKGKQTSFSQKFRKYHDSSLDADDTESELVAIPESDQSDSTLHGGSAPGSFDDPLHFEEIATPLRSEIFKGKNAQITTSNLAQLAMSTLGVTERIEDKHESKKIKKITTTDKSNNQNNTTVTTTTTIESSSKISVTHSKCTVQEGVRMMVTPSMFGTPAAALNEKVIVNPPPTVHKSVVVTQSDSTSKMFANIANSQLRTVGAVAIVGNPTSQANAEEIVVTSKPPLATRSNGTNWIEPRTQSPTSRQLGRQKRIPDTNTAPTSQAGTPSPSIDDIKSFSRSHSRRNAKSFDKSDCLSPESPMSKMNILPNPQDTPDSMMSPKSISQLEIPTQERLLPIGQLGKDGMESLVDKVREALSITDIGHTKRDRNNDKSGVSGIQKDGCSSQHSRATSPRRLIKQVALESPPTNASDEYSSSHQHQHTTTFKTVSHEIKSDKCNAKEESYLTQRQRLRKTGPFAVDSQQIPDARIKYAGSWPPQDAYLKDDTENQDDDGGGGNDQYQSDEKQSSNRVGDDCVCHRCSECGVLLEEYSDEEIGIMVIALGTFIHREAAIAAPFLPEILSTVTKYAMRSTFPWQQYNSTSYLPGGSQSVAHQFIRCVLHQLAPNGIFVQMFLTQAAETQRRKYFKSIAKALIDFQELNPTSPVHMLVDNLNSKKTLPLDTLPTWLRNLGEYLQCVPVDAGTGSWPQVVQGIETLFRRIILSLQTLDEPTYLLDIMVSLLKIPGVSKGVLEPFSKILSHCLQNSIVKHKVLNDLCSLSAKAFSKERDKHQLTRQTVFELVQALKFKTNIPDVNLLLLVGFILQDAGGVLPPGIIDGLDTLPVYTTNAADCTRQYLNDIVDFLADFHTLSKIKNFKNGSVVTGLSEDTLGGILKGAIAQFLALEMSRGNSRDNKAVSRYLPWLYNVPSSLQQGPKEITECLSHIRLLSWLLIGALTHTALMTHKGGLIGQHGAAVHYHIQHPGHTTAQPIPQEASCHIADHIQTIFAGFSEQSKTSVIHMSTLFHAFTLCQLWTVYLEQLSCISQPTSEAHNVTMTILFEFWGKVTPSILQIVSTSKIVSEMVNLHFLSLLEGLKETGSTILAKLLPLWSPVLSSQTQLSVTLHVRLQGCRDFAPSIDNQEVHPSEVLLKWLQRLQFKMGQIELQSSTATQFYSI
ncbi:hypothetical protein HA402_012808 [Bradysia odoriphaga]|nr:hypothetical protein HA402_012808 [Bradysia odoriphaga]